MGAPRRRAGVSTLGVIDRIVYSDLEPLIALAAAAAVTERIRLTTSILLGPARRRAPGQAGGERRPALRRPVDARPGARRARRRLRGRQRGLRHPRAPLDEQLAELQRIWSGDEIGPDHEPELILGGTVEASFRRAAIQLRLDRGGMPPDAVKEILPEMRQAWDVAGRSDEPRILGLAYLRAGPRPRGCRRGLPQALLQLRRPGRRDRRRGGQGRRHGQAVRGGVRRRGPGRAHLLPLLGRPRAGGPAGRGRALARARQPGEAERHREVRDQIGPQRRKSSSASGEGSSCPSTRRVVVGARRAPGPARGRSRSSNLLHRCRWSAIVTARGL